MSDIWKLASAYVTGRGHLAKNIPCQDRTYQLIRNHSSGTLYGLALADGAGSCKFSHIGAEIVTKDVLTYLKSNFATLLKIKSASNKVLNYVEDRIAFEARKREIQSKDLSSTLLFVVVKNGTYIAGHIGDGVIGCIDKKNKVSVLSHPDNGEYSNYTFFTTSKNYPNRLKIMKGETADILGFILMSDGTANSLYDNRNKLLASVNADIINWLDNGNSQEIEAVIKGNLDTVIKEKTHDDCSLGVLKKC